MGYPEQQQPQGGYPTVPPQGYPTHQQQNAPYPQQNAYPPMNDGTGMTSTAGPHPAGTYPPMHPDGVTAPGGYTAAPAAGPPGMQDPRYIPEANKPAPSGYPNTYPPQGSAAPPATGYPIHHAAPPAGMQGMNIHQPQPTAAAATMPGNERCGCSIGWVLFAVGWLLPICWMVGVVLPFCTKSRNDRRASYASGIMLIIYIVLIVALATTQSRRAYYANPGYNSNYYG